MIYGGGGVGLMGACAMAAHEAGGKVLGVIPHFLKEKERRLDVVETIVVSSMHERKQIVFERSDGFVVLPGGIGTLEEVVELLSWRRLDSCTSNQWFSITQMASGSRCSSSSSTRSITG